MAISIPRPNSRRWGRVHRPGLRSVFRFGGHGDRIDDAGHHQRGGCASAFAQIRGAGDRSPSRRPTRGRRPSGAGPGHLSLPGAALCHRRHQRRSQLHGPLGGNLFGDGAIHRGVKPPLRARRRHGRSEPNGCHHRPSGRDRLAPGHLRQAGPGYPRVWRAGDHRQPGFRHHRHQRILRVRRRADRHLPDYQLRPRDRRQRNHLHHAFI